MVTTVSLSTSVCCVAVDVTTALHCGISMPAQCPVLAYCNIYRKLYAPHVLLGSYEGWDVLKSSHTVLAYVAC